MGHVAGELGDPSVHVEHFLTVENIIPLPSHSSSIALMGGRSVFCHHLA